MSTETPSTLTAGSDTGTAVLEAPAAAPEAAPSAAAGPTPQAPSAAAGPTPQAPSVPVAVAPAPGFSITSLALGVASIFFGLTFVAPIAGLVFGILALRREPHGRTMAIWGIVLNAANLAFAAILVLMAAVFALGVPLFALADPSNY